MDQRVRSLESASECHGQWIKGHEDRCAERYGELKSDMKMVRNGIIALMIGVMGWLAVQLWNTKVDRPATTVIQNRQVGPSQ